MLEFSTNYFALSAIGESASISVMTSSNQTATQNVTSIANSLHHHPTTIQSSVHVRLYYLF